MTIENLFITASRQQFRFETVRGMVTTEDLWAMPLQSKSNFDLDSVAKAVNAALIAATDTSFVATKTNPAKATLEAKLELIKYIIAVKLAENEAANNAAARKVELDKLTSILGKKQDAALEGLSTEELQKKITELASK